MTMRLSGTVIEIYRPSHLNFFYRKAFPERKVGRRSLIVGRSVFTRESSYCFQRVLAIAILSVCLSVTQVNQSKTVEGKITKSSSSAARKTLVSGSLKLFHKFEGAHPERRRQMRRGWAKFAIFGQ